MKKIMFNDRFSLTQAVLDGRKTMTRRIIKAPRRTIEGKEVCGFAIHKTHEGVPYEVWLTGPDDESLCQLLPTYKVGEIVAVAEPYKDVIGDRVFFKSSETGVSVHRSIMEREKGWSNKMFVASEFMRNRIRITGIKVERLQDISWMDCVKEGIIPRLNVFGRVCDYEYCGLGYDTPQRAFQEMINDTCGKGTWERNPWVFAYTFELLINQLYN